MKDSYRLLIAFLFILPATLVAQPDRDVRPSIVENLEQINRDVSLKPDSFKASMSLTEDTVPKEGKSRNNFDSYEGSLQSIEGQQPVLPDSSSTASIIPN